MGQSRKNANRTTVASSTNHTYELSFLLLWAVLVLYAYLSHGHGTHAWLVAIRQIFPPIWNTKPELIPSLLILATPPICLTLLVVIIGNRLLRFFSKLGNLNSFESIAASYGLGTMLFSFFFFLLAVAGVLNRPLGWSLLIALTVVALFHVRTILHELKLDEERPSFVSSATTDRLFAGATALVGALLFYFALAPEVFYDALVYHLAIPKLWWLEGGAVANGSLMYSGIPSQFQMMYGWALLIGHESAAKIIHLAAAGATVMMLVGAARRWGVESAGWPSALLYLTTPVVALNATVAGVDAASAFGVLASVHFLALAATRDSPAEGGQSAFLAGIFCGLALASKYTNWPLLIVETVFLLYGRVGLRVTLIFVGSAAACLMPWIFRNLLNFNNPIYPFFSDSIGLDEFKVNWRALFVDARGRNWGALSSNPAALGEVLAHPWNLTIKGNTAFDEIGPVYLLFLPTLYIHRKLLAGLSLFLFVLGGLWLSWWPASGIVRFFLGGLAILCLLIAAAIRGETYPWVSNLQCGLILLLSLNNLSSILGYFYRQQSASFLISGVNRSEYLKKQRDGYPNPSQPAIEWLNQNSNPQERVLLVGESRAAYLNRPFMASSAFDPPIFFELVKNSQNVQELHSQLKMKGLSFILLNTAALMARGVPMALPPEKQSLLKEYLEKHAALVFEDKDFGERRWNAIYRIRG